MSTTLRFWLISGASIGIGWLLFIFILFPDPESIDEQLEAFRVISDSNDLWHKGVRHHGAGNLDDAMALYNQAIEINPESEYALLYRGKLRYDLNDYDGAIEDFTRAIELNSGFAYAFNARGVARYRGGDQEGAIEDAEYSYTLDPQSNTSLINMAVMKKLDNDLPGASAIFAELEAHPTQEQDPGRFFLMNSAAVKFEQGDSEGALEDLSKLINVDPKILSHIQFRPSYFRGYLIRSEVYNALNQTKKADADLKRYTELLTQYNMVILEIRKELNPDLNQTR